MRAAIGRDPGAGTSRQCRQVFGESGSIRLYFCKETSMKQWLLGCAVSILACMAWAADPPPSAAPLAGKVLEVKDIDSYTYLRLKTKDGEIWAAVNKSPVKVGADVAIANPTVMTNFESKTLKKTFDRIVFGSLAAPGASAASKGADMGSLHAGMTKPVDAGDVKVAKASGPDARTVAEVNARRADLKGKPVLVRGKVAKFTPGVMGKNWLHLRDGSGSEADGSNDIVVTTLDETKIGDVVLVKGVVATDRDLGSGYKYKVLIEEATLQK
jgi:hypothetical protein